MMVLHVLSHVPSKLLVCRQQFSLLLYGYGSKRKLLETFASSTLQDGGVLSISGLFPGLTIKQLLLRVACMIKRAHHSHFRWGPVVSSSRLVSTYCSL